jgi:Transposase
MAKDRKAAKVIENTIEKRNDKKQVESIAKNFLVAVAHLNDPRQADQCDYPLHEILFIAVIAVLCGSESFEDFATFGKAQTDWLKQFLALENGTPSHDTFRRVFMMLKPNSLNEAYQIMIQALDVEPGKHIAIDGKKSRGCYNEKGKSLLNVVSAWDTENGISLGQHATKNGDNKEVGEFNTIPELIDMLDIDGRLVTIDAGGCYTEITGSVVNGGGDYAITLKENQPTLYKEAEKTFQELESKGYRDVPCYEESGKGHGRVERRTYYSTPLVDEKLQQRWPGLQTLILGLFERTVNDKTSYFRRYYISSLKGEEISRLGMVLRHHWGIENNLHWVLDVSFGEDGNRTRRGHGAENLSTLRRLALAMLGQVKGKKTIPNIMFRAAVDPMFRSQIVLKFLM